MLIIGDIAFKIKDCDTKIKNIKYKCLFLKSAPKYSDFMSVDQFEPGSCQPKKTSESSPNNDYYYYGCAMTSSSNQILDIKYKRGTLQQTELSQYLFYSIVGSGAIYVFLTIITLYMEFKNNPKEGFFAMDY